MIRPTSLRAAAGALLVAAGALSSCATFEDNANAARVGAVELPIDDIQALLDSDEQLADASLVRAELTKWVRVVLLETANGAPAAEASSVANLDTRLGNALNQLADDNLDTGRELYEQGPGASATVCLSGIPLESADDAATVLDELAGGVSFADAAATWSSDPGLADSGGVILMTDGRECLGLDEVAPELAEQMVGETVGEPFLIDLAGFATVLLIRPYDELTDDSKRQLALAANSNSVLPALISEADVYIDPLYGYWDTDVAEVLPLGG